MHRLFRFQADGLLRRFFAVGAGATGSAIELRGEPGRIVRRIPHGERILVDLVFHADDALHDEVGSLYEWLRRSDQLSRSPVDLVPRSGRPGEMGGVSDLVVNLNWAEVVAIVSVVTSWLRFRGVDLDVEDTRSGYRVRIRRLSKRGDHAGAQLAEKLLRDRDANNDREYAANPADSAPDDDGPVTSESR